MPEEAVCLDDQPRQKGEQDRQIWALGEVLAELLAAYQARYPELNAILVETESAAAL